MSSDPDLRPHLRPLKEAEAKPLFRQIMENGTVSFSPHANKEMDNDDLSSLDCRNVLRCGVVTPDGFVNGEWRYRVSTNRITVVVSLLSRTRLRVVTVWRNQR
jgi:hypothetical protein